MSRCSDCAHYDGKYCDIDDKMRDSNDGCNDDYEERFQ